MPSTVPLSFGEFTLDPQRHELRVGDQVVNLQPKAFQVLTLLVSERHRVVSRAELLEAFWAGTTRSPSTLLQIISRLRRALLDDPQAPQWIANVHGVGYRFIGAVDMAGGARQPASPSEVTPAHSGAVTRMPRARVYAPKGTKAAAPPRRDRLRVGILPCLNRTGDAALDWSRSGLMVLVEGALAMDARVVVTHLTRLAATMRLTEPGSTLEHNTHAVLYALSLDAAVQASLVRQPDGLWLTYCLRWSDGREFHGALCDVGVLEVGERFAQDLYERLLQEPAPAQLLTVRDPFASQCLARAIELYAQESDDLAAPLFQVAWDMEPDNWQVALWRLLCWSRMGDPRAADLGEATVRQLAGSAPLKARATAYRALANYYQLHNDPALSEHGRAHEADALALTAGRETEDWALEERLNAGVTAVKLGYLEGGRLMFLTAERDARAVGNRLRLATALLSRAALDITVGDLVVARERLEEALRIDERLRRDNAVLFDLALLAYVKHAKGLCQAAWADCYALLARCDTRVRSPWLAPFFAMAALVYLARADLPRINDLLVQLARLPRGSHALVAAPTCAVLAMQAALQGQFLLARSRLEAAIGLAAEGPGVILRWCWERCLLRLLLASGDYTGAALRLERFGFPQPRAADVEMQGVGHHVRAAVALRDGRDDDCLQLLEQSITHVPNGIEHALARLDAAWLCLNRGDSERAQSYLTGMGTWTAQHPMGLAAQSRLLSAQGQAAEAALLATQAQRLCVSVVPTWWLVLVGDPAVAEAHAGRLLSDLWLPSAAAG